MDLDAVTGLRKIIKRVESIGIVPPERDNNLNHARQIYFWDRSYFFVSAEFAKSIKHNSHMIVFQGDEKGESAIYGPLEKDKLFSEF